MKLKPSIAVSLLVTVLHSMSGNVTFASWDTAVNGRRASDMDGATSVAVDPVTGGIFVAGRLQVASDEAGFLIAKWSSDGTKLWQHVVAGRAGFDYAVNVPTIAVSTDGFVYAAGSIDGHLFIIKMNGRSSRKRVLWTRAIDGPGFGDAVHAMVLTPDGGVGIAGMVRAGDGTYRFYVMKFTKEGEDAWPGPQILSGTNPRGLSMARAIGVLADGDLVVTGFLDNATTREDLVVGRFAGSTGERRWLNVNPDPRNGTDIGSALAVAPNGDIVVGGSIPADGSFPEPIGQDVVILRVTGAGNLVWQRRINRGFSDSFGTLAVTPSGDVIATGVLSTDDTDDSEFFVMSLDGDGRERWRFESPLDDSFRTGRAITFDADGNPVVVGLGEGPDVLSAFVVRAFDKSLGTVLWDLPIAGTAPLWHEGRAAAFNPQTGGVVAVGVTQNERTSLDATVVHIRNGSEDWRRLINGRGKTINREDGALALAVDPRHKGIALVGFRQDTANLVQEFSVVRVRKNGSVMWKYDLHDPSPHLDNAALAIAADPGGDFFVAGRTCSTFSTSCFTVARISAVGGELWRMTVAGEHADTEARAIVVDPSDGNLIVAGALRTTFPADFVMYKLDAMNGSVLWQATERGGPLDGSQALTLTERGTVAVATTGSVCFCVLEFDTRTGAGMSRGSLPAHGHASAVAFDRRDGTVVAAGWIPLAVAPGYHRLFVAKFSFDGTVLWSQELPHDPREGGGPEGAFLNATVAAVAVHPSTGDIAVVGALLGPGENSSVHFAAVVALLAADGSVTWRTEKKYGAAHDIAFSGDDLVVAGQSGPENPDRSQLFTVTAYSHDGAERWQDTFGVPNVARDSSTSGSANAVVVEDGTAFVAGWIQQQETSRDMFAVALPVGGPTLTASPTTVPAGGTVTAEWTGIVSPTATDWIGLFPSGAADTAYVDYVYVSCTKTPGAALAAGSCPFVVPGNVAAGSYQLRLFGHDNFVVMGTSNTFTVSP